ncbi:uncharacterized protein [Parasteatoda tepidariorum]|uniref:uncharacterized protein isoform X2 n=1 Tax=Parasteatoda tepidariorum TaxID=114398 RepID=UPI0039BD1A71
MKFAIVLVCFDLLVLRIFAGKSDSYSKDKVMLRRVSHSNRPGGSLSEPNNDIAQLDDSSFQIVSNNRIYLYYTLPSYDQTDIPTLLMQG